MSSINQGFSFSGFEYSAKNDNNPSQLSAIYTKESIDGTGGKTYIKTVDIVAKKSLGIAGTLKNLAANIGLTQKKWKSIKVDVQTDKGIENKKIYLNINSVNQNLGNDSIERIKEHGLQSTLQILHSEKPEEVHSIVHLPTGIEISENQEKLLKKSGYSSDKINTAFFNPNTALAQISNKEELLAAQELYKAFDLALEIPQSFITKENVVFLFDAALDAKSEVLIDKCLSYINDGHSEDYKPIKFEKGIYKLEMDVTRGVNSGDIPILREVARLLPPEKVKINLEATVFNQRGDIKAFINEFSQSITTLNFSGDAQSYKLFENCENLLSLKLNRCVVDEFEISCIKNLEILDVVDCSIAECPNLGSLENLKAVNFSLCQRLHSLEILSESKSIESLTIGGCGRITLPASDSLKSITVNSCSGFDIPEAGLTNLENLFINHTSVPDNIKSVTSLKNINIQGCTQMGNELDLSGMVNLQDLQISRSGLKEISLQDNSNLTSLVIVQSDLITAPDLSSLTNLVSLNISSCVHMAGEVNTEGLENLTDQIIEGNGTNIAPVYQAENFRNFDSKKIQLIIDHNKIETAPENLIKTFSSKITPDKTKLSVEYKGGKGIDAGGLSRQFISELFESLCDKLDFTTQIPPYDKKNSDTYSALGKVFNFILKADRLKTGEVFAENLFTVMLELSYEEVNGSFDDIGLVRLLEIYAKTENLPPDTLSEIDNQQRILSWNYDEFGPNTAEGAELIGKIKELNDAYYYEIDFPATDDWTKEEATNILKQVHDIMLGEFEFAKKLRTVHAIAKGMGNTQNGWEALKKEGAEALQTNIQGVFDKERLKNKINFDEKMPKEMMGYMIKWIDNGPDSKIKDFLAYCTGSTVVPDDPLNFRLVKNESVYVHSCFGLIDMPKSMFKPPHEDLENLFYLALDANSQRGATYNRS